MPSAKVTDCRQAHGCSPAPQDNPSDGFHTPFLPENGPLRTPYRLIKRELKRDDDDAKTACKSGQSGASKEPVLPAHFRPRASAAHPSAPRASPLRKRQKTTKILCKALRIPPKLQKLHYAKCVIDITQRFQFIENKTTFVRVRNYIKQPIFIKMPLKNMYNF